MQIFKNNKQALSALREMPFKLERDIQNLFEQNLEMLTSLKLVKSEFTIKQSRIDTLAFDPESKAFVIIEFLTISRIKKSKSAPSIRQVQQNDDTEIGKVTEEIKVYTEEDHLAGKSDHIKELYDAYKAAILNLSADIEVEAKKLYLAFKKTRNVVDIRIQSESLKMWINLKKDQLLDEKGLARDVSQSGHWGNGDYELIVKDTANLEYIMSLVQQVLTFV